MERLSVQEMISRIEREEPFDAVALDYSFTLKIDRYVHYVCGAVHDGGQFRKELWDNCLHSAYDRWYEEDPCTKAMIHTHPIVIAGCDSRFEYDLNRGPDDAVFETAWGKQLWKQPLPRDQHDRSMAKHNSFYEIVHVLISKLESLFGMVVVYDIHSYNWKRWDREVPVINIGTVNLDNDRFGRSIEQWRNSLEGLNLPGVQYCDSKINDTFFGNGYFLKYITSSFQNTLVLATEFKKIYCDELRQVIYPEVVRAINHQLVHKLPHHAQAFYADHKVV
ncbi:N-formylglutamate amidohydrolase [Aureitalea marina]|uniref:N-formylglutamate amidohydrolase n=1 Tax=Aureitalea marina TaxID=930804 RepID=A0A2S7KP16_9FLAO|nr:N-formylglutamate amidohydrolase [Aureitalea marina]PQB04374.1 hypothetical protein BST85_05275 [Aureitalea marina]